MQEVIYRVRIVVEKYGMMRYFSQLDLVRIFERALRRAGFPLYFTKGFNPHPKMSFGDALKLGVEGRICITVSLSEPISSCVFREKLQKQLPEGLKIAEITSN